MSATVPNAEERERWIEAGRKLLVIWTIEHKIQFTAIIFLPKCMSECVMNRTGIFNPRKSINGEKAMNAFTDKLSDKSVWGNVVEKAVKDCLSQAAARKSDFDKDTQSLQAQYKNDRICSPAAGFIMECVHVSVYKVDTVKF